MATKPTQRDLVTVRRLEKVAKRWRTKHDASMDRHASSLEGVFDASVRQTTPTVNSAIDALETSAGGAILPSPANRKLVTAMETSLLASTDATYGSGGPLDASLGRMGDDALASGLARYKDTAKAADQKLPPPNFGLSAEAQRRYARQVEQLRLGFYSAETVNVSRYKDAFLRNINDPKGTRSKLRADLSALGFDSPKPMLDTLGRRISTDERADRISRYEFPRLARIAEDEAIDQWYYDGKPPAPAQKFYLWTAVGDARTQPEHLARHGKVLSLAEWNKREWGDGRVGLAPLRPRCRCDSVFVDRKWFSQATQDKHFGTDAEPLLPPVAPPAPKPKAAPVIEAPVRDPALPAWADRWWNPAIPTEPYAMKTTDEIERWLVDSGHILGRADFKGTPLNVAQDVAAHYAALAQNTGLRLHGLGNSASVRKALGMSTTGSDGESTWAWANNRHGKRGIGYNPIHFNSGDAAYQRAVTSHLMDTVEAGRYHGDASYTPLHLQMLYHEFGHQLDWDDALAATMGEGWAGKVTDPVKWRNTYLRPHADRYVELTGEKLSAEELRDIFTGYSSSAYGNWKHAEFPSEAFSQFMLNAPAHTTALSKALGEDLLRKVRVAVRPGAKMQVIAPDAIEKTTFAVLEKQGVAQAGLIEADEILKLSDPDAIIEALLRSRGGAQYVSPGRVAYYKDPAQYGLSPETAQGMLLQEAKTWARMHRAQRLALARATQRQFFLYVDSIMADVVNWTPDFTAKVLADKNMEAIFGARIRAARGTI